MSNKKVPDRRSVLGLSVGGALGAVALTAKSAAAQTSPDVLKTVDPLRAKPQLTLKEFSIMGAGDPTFLMTYTRDPLRLKDRYTVSDDTLDAIVNKKKLLEEVGKVSPDTLPEFKKNLESNASGSFNDGFGDRGFKDRFRDGGDGGHKDRFKDSN